MDPVSADDVSSAPGEDENSVTRADDCCPRCGHPRPSGSAPCPNRHCLSGYFYKPREASEPGSAEENPGLKFGLGDTFLVVTLICVIMGIWVSAPGLSILFALVAAPALIRTIHLSQRDRAAGYKMDFFELFGTFLTATAAVAMAWLAFVMSFVIACSGIGGAIVPIQFVSPTLYGLLIVPTIFFSLGFGVWLSIRMLRQMWE